MPDDPRVQDLLDELLDSDATPEQVCGSRIDLLPAVRDRWREVCRARDELDAMFPPDAGPGATRPASPWGEPNLPAVAGYEVQAVLGRGGMGVVLRARHLGLDRLVALKMMISGAYAGARERERFRREAGAVAALRHPNVVQVHDVGESDGRPFFTMEYVEGGSLADGLDGTPRPAREAAELLATLAGAVQAAHDAGIVHRDLKPANVLLAAGGTPKVGDFGLARRLGGEAGLTRTGTAVGTPSYMAPEQALGHPDAAEPAVDVYALGAILYELLAGRPPFRAETAAETVHQLLTQEPVPPSRLNGRVPRDLETVCLTCLHKEPNRRYGNAAALADDLRRFLGGEPIAARPESRLRRLARRVHRRPVLSGAVAVATLSTLTLVVGGAWTASERSAAKRELSADVAATDRAAEQDLNEMAAALKKSSWPAARTALERAKARLGDRGSAELRRRAERGTLDLNLAVRLDEIRLNRAVAGQPWSENYEKAFGEAGVARFGDDADAVAKRVRQSDIRQALIDALDDWSLCASPARHAPLEAWLLDVTRRADPDPWRDRVRDPEARKSKAALIALAGSADVERTPVNLLTALGDLLLSRGGDAVPFFSKVQRRYPNDFWANLFLAHHTKVPADAIRYYQAALALRPGTPYLYFNLGWVTVWDRRLDEALGYFSEAVRLNPKNATFRAGLARCLQDLNRHGEALDQLNQALALDPSPATFGVLQGVRKLDALRRGELDEALPLWKSALDADPERHVDWYGYAELCLFLGREDEYRRARRALLAKFGDSDDPATAERTARAGLLRPASGDELKRAVALAERAAGVDRAKYPATYPFFQFVAGLARFRQGHFDRAIAVMRGEAGKVLRPAPQLVLAMALHRSGQEAEAMKTLAEAVSAYDWRPGKVRDQDDWIRHALRREAEGMILPNMPAFLEGKYQPRDNDERLAFLGVCQFTNRSRTVAQLCADAFANDPSLAANVRAGLRLSAACAAAQAGCGRGIDAAPLDQPARAKWRAQAREWLRADLAAWAKELDGTTAGIRDTVSYRLGQWRADPDLAGLRAPDELTKLPADERKDCLALWGEVEAVLKRAK